jgi:hypothetical protein
MFPSIGYISKKNLVNFGEDNQCQFEKVPLLKYIRNTINIEDNLIIIVKGWTSTNLNPIYNRIREQRPKKIIFFIYDILRIYSTNCATNIRNSSLIEKEPLNARSPELDTVKIITSEFDLPFEVYHCEANCEIFQDCYDFPINYFDLFIADYIQTDAKLHLKKQQNNLKKNYRFSSFSARFEPHKYIITTYLLGLENSLCSQLQKMNNDNLSKTLLQDNLVLSNEKLRKIYDNNLKNKNKKHSVRTRFKPYSTDKDFVYKNISAREQKYNVNEISRSWIHVVNESRFTMPMANISEKTIKPIIARCPFIVASGPFSLRLLQGLGFKTFSDFWDESYDEEPDHSKRLEKILDLIDYLNSLKIKELKKMHGKMSSVLDYNLARLECVNYDSFKNLKTFRDNLQYC